jgi:formate dehydrogenase subunit gamma
MKRILFLAALFASASVISADAPQALQVKEQHNNVRLWQDVRAEQPQFTTVRGIETGVLIQSGGETWRELRNGPVTLYGGILLCVALAGIALFYRLRGPLKLKEARTGRLVERFNLVERTAHWSMAGSFVVLAISGLNMLFGKHVLMPLLGHSLFSWLAIICKNLHNFVGPLFLFSIVVSFFIFVKDNLWNKADALWIAKLGGLFSGEHVPSWRFNFGEKAWFWIGLVCLGLTLSISGLFLDFPNFEQGRSVMQSANIVHVIAALLFTSMALGHIYIGTIGTEGAIEAMRDGCVDEAWAKEHHEYWYEEQKGKAAAGEATKAAPASGAAAAQS